jgi:hypothetical protein
VTIADVWTWVGHQSAWWLLVLPALSVLGGLMSATIGTTATLRRIERNTEERR